MLKVYGIKNCDSVKKAISFFKKNDLKYELFDYKIDQLPCEKIEQWLQMVEVKTLFNARSTTYRNLKLKELQLSEDEKAQWLCKENLLIKRPVIEYASDIIVGFNEDLYQRSLL